MKVIFLDIDGVLNSAAFFETPVLDFADGAGNIDRAAVARLNRITDTTGAKIVVSSTWRFSRGDAELRDLFASVGITGEFAGATLRKFSCDRGTGVTTWLREPAHGR